MRDISSQRVKAIKSLTSRHIQMHHQRQKNNNSSLFGNSPIIALLCWAGGCVEVDRHQRAFAYARQWQSICTLLVENPSCNKTILGSITTTTNRAQTVRVTTRRRATRERFNFSASAVIFFSSSI